MKIPPQAKKVFKGVIFDVYQWKQKMFDGSTETFEMLKRPDTVQVIPVTHDKIMIADEEQPGGAWRGLGLFGGRVDAGEEPLAAAKRELLEETGLESDDWELFRSYEPYGKIEWMVHYYIARNCRKTREPTLDAGEKIEVKEASLVEFIALAASPEFHAGEFGNDMLRLWQNEENMREFRGKLFGRSL